MRFGYARVSTGDQSLGLQVSTLHSYQCQEIFTDQISGSKWVRPGLKLLTDRLQPGDEVAVWKVDRLGRNLIELMNLIDSFTAKEVRFTSLTEGFDSGTAGGRMLLQMIGSFAEFERAMIRERTKAGLKVALDNGVRLGRTPRITEEKEKLFLELVERTDLTNAQKAARLGVSQATFYRRLRKKPTPLVE